MVDERLITMARGALAAGAPLADVRRVLTAHGVSDDDLFLAWCAAGMLDEYAQGLEGSRPPTYVGALDRNARGACKLVVRSLRDTVAECRCGRWTYCTMAFDLDTDDDIRERVGRAFDEHARGAGRRER